MKLNARALGFTLGIIWGIAILITTLIALWSTGAYGRSFLYMLASIYPGYSVTIVGSFLGLCYGFADGFVFGWLTAKIYNFFAKE